MDKNLIAILLVLVMAVVTYVIRMIPFVFFRKKIKSRFITSLLYYIPYAVLAAMTFPAALYATGNVAAAAIGIFAAVIFAIMGKSLTVVALISSLTVFISEILLKAVF